MSNSGEGYLDLRKMLSFVLSKWIWIALYTTLVSSGVVLYSLSLPNQYISSAVVKTDSGKSGASSILNQYRGVASLAGITMPLSGAQNDAFEAKSLILSKSFLKGLLETNPDILPSIMAPKEFNKLTQELIFDPNLYNSISRTWVRETTYPYEKVPTFVEAYEYYEGLVSVEIDQVTQYIKISVKHISPVFARNLLTAIVDHVNFISKQKALDQSQKALDFLAAERSKNQLLSVDQAMNYLFEEQLKTKMLANIYEDFLVKYIDYPFLPLKKSGPYRSIICMIGFFIALFSALGYFITQFVLRELKAK